VTAIQVASAADLKAMSKHEIEVRTRCAQIMDATVANAGNWHYLAHRDLVTPNLGQAEHGIVEADCSKGDLDINFLAGAKDWTKGYGGARPWQGNSVAAFHGCVHIERAHLRVGDSVVWGNEGRIHMAKVRTIGKVTKLWGMGSEAGPSYRTFAQNNLYFKSKFYDGTVTTCLRLPL